MVARARMVLRLVGRSGSARGLATDAGTRPPRFTYKVAEAYAAKSRLDDDGPPKPPPGGRAGTGEDSFFRAKWTRQGAERGAVSLGVADGVGGWATIGIDPSRFSHSLCKRMASLFASHDGEQQPVSPLYLLDTAFDELVSKGEEYAGGSTACVGVASARSGVLRTANLGDSGFFVLRKGRIYARSEPQTHKFNTPYQLAIVPQKMLREHEARHGGSRQICDMPTDADTDHVQLEHGDVVVFATDGLTDNLYAHEVLSLVTQGMLEYKSWYLTDREHIDAASDPSHGCQAIARALVRAAMNASLDPNLNSPFAAQLRKDLGFLSQGGKPDDITVLVLTVCDNEHESLSAPESKL